jgi:hypothetical protein
VFHFSQRLVSSFMSRLSEVKPGAASAVLSAGGPTSQAFLNGPSSHRVPPSPRELPDVTGFLVVVIVTLGLFVVPVGATIMQGPAIVASILGR